MTGRRALIAELTAAATARHRQWKRCATALGSPVDVFMGPGRGDGFRLEPRGTVNAYMLEAGGTVWSGWVRIGTILPAPQRLTNHRKRS